MKPLITMLVALSLCSCSTMSRSRKNTLITIGAFIAGSAIGAATTPDDTETHGHAILIGGPVAAATAIYLNEKYSSEKRVKKLEAELAKLKELNSFVKVDEEEGYFVDPFTKKRTKEIWEIKKGSQWVEEGPGSKYHIDIRINKKGKK